MTLVVLTFPFVQAKGNPETGLGLLLAVNQGEATLGIVDPQAGKQVATIAEGGVTGHEVAVSLDGKTAYVPIYGDSSVGQRERMAETWSRLTLRPAKSSAILILDMACVRIAR